jgi:hypothetical protein
MKKVLLITALFLPIAAETQKPPIRVALSSTSTVASSDLRRGFQKKCPNVILNRDPSRADYALEAIDGRSIRSRPWKCHATASLSSTAPETRSIPHPRTSSRALSTTYVWRSPDKRQRTRQPQSKCLINRLVPDCDIAIASPPIGLQKACIDRLGQRINLLGAKIS